MSNNVTNAVNQQGSSLLHLMEYNPSETTRRIPQMNKELATKNHVLKLMVASYGKPAKIYNLPKFHLR